MVRKRKDVTDAELAVLHALWEAGSATIRWITERLYPAGSESDYATVKKLLHRLEAKGYVARERTSPAHQFRAQLSQADLLDRRLQAVADHLCNGSRTPLLMHLLQTERLSSEQRTQLREHLDSLIQQLAPKGRSHGNPRGSRRK